MFRADDIVVSALGFVGPGGLWNGSISERLLREDIAPLSLESFDPGLHLSDRRLQKAISKSHAIGLVAFEACQRAAAFPSEVDPWRLGLYVGAPPSLVSDSDNYLEAVAQTNVGGSYDFSAFGRTCMGARPTTLLLGLPNNVLCYGSILANAQGPNSNYTTSELSSQTAVVNAWRRLHRGKIDYAYAGGFATHWDSICAAMYRGKGVLRMDPKQEIEPFSNYGTVLADTGIFVALERRSSMQARGKAAVATVLGAAQGGHLADTMRHALAVAGIEPRAVRLVFTQAQGIAGFDQEEMRQVSTVFDCEKPAIASTARLLGNQMEAGGLIELALVDALKEEVPERLRVLPQGVYADFETKIATSKRAVMILRSSLHGGATCLVVREGGE